MPGRTRNADKRERIRDRRIHPKLSVICNGDERVNAIRAETAGCLRVDERLASKLPALTSAVAADKVSVAATKISDLPSARRAVEIHVFVEAADFKRVKNITAQQGDIATARIALDDVDKLMKNPAVAYVAPAESLKYPKPLRSSTGSPALKPRAESVGRPEKHKKGQGILVGIIDVEGFDWAHPDFLDAKGKTRFVRLWDQGGESRPAPDRKGGRFDYGAEFTDAHFTQALADAAKVKVSPHDLEPQSQMVVGSHGTHVCSIAAGNSGVCPEATIAAVLISLPPEDLTERRMSFYDSTRIVDAIEYLLRLADKLDKPVSINVSLGTNGAAHDGSTPLDRWLDALLAKPGRSICVAAGNAGQEAPQRPDDWGYMLGRIHTGGRIASKGLNHDLEWIVAGDGVKDVSENELEIWYEPQDRFEVLIKPPGPGGNWLGPISAGEYIENYQIPGHKTLLSVYNELYHVANGNNCISIYLSPFMKKPIVGIKAGRWVVRLMGSEIRDGRFHGWIERDDPVRGEDGAFYFPSYFSERSNVDSSSVSSLACGQRVVSVANLDEAEERINVSSSQGPTRDGRLKPDVAAPGTDVWAANGFARAAEPWIKMTGTSMASPYVAGVVGLMLAAQPTLTAAQINGIIKATAKPLPGKNYEWVNDSGFGVVNATACVAEAATANVRTDAKAHLP